LQTACPPRDNRHSPPGPPPGYPRRPRSDIHLRASQTGPAPSMIRVLPRSSNTVRSFSLRRADGIVPRGGASWRGALEWLAPPCVSMECAPFPPPVLLDLAAPSRGGEGCSGTGAAEECRLRDGAISPPRRGAAQRSEAEQFTEIFRGCIWGRAGETAARTLRAASRSRP
jgi:hypothetical protein